VFQGLFQSVTSFLIINSHKNKHRQNPNNKLKKLKLINDYPLQAKKKLVKSSEYKHPKTSLHSKY
jgi:hypothetical protein